MIGFEFQYILEEPLTMLGDFKLELIPEVMAALLILEAIGLGHLHRPVNASQKFFMDPFAKQQAGDEATEQLVFEDPQHQ